MPLQKTPISIDFLQGIDTKSDPLQIPIGKFANLENTIFDKARLLQKRNGNAQLTSLPDSSYRYATTFNTNLLAIGTSLAAYSGASSTWASQGSLQPTKLSVLPILRSSSNQTQCDAAISINNLACVVYTDTNPSTVYKYVVVDTITGQNIVAPTTIATPSESPRVFLLNNYFVILYSQGANLKYIVVPINSPSSPIAAVTLVTNYAIGGTMLAFDGIVSNNNLYVSYNASDGGGAIRMTYLNAFLVRQTAGTGVVLAAAKSATMVSVCADSSGPVIWTSFYLTAGTTGYVVAVDQSINSILVATQFVAAGTLLNLTSTANAGVVTVFYEVSTTYSYGGQTNLITKRTCTNAGALGTATVVARSVGLASKAFLISSNAYMLAAYSSSYQPSYFLIDSSGNVIGKLAYSNGGGYLTLGLPQVSVNSTTASMGYLIKDLIQAANKSQSPANQAPVYIQTGVNLASFIFSTTGMNSSEIGGNLHISGGILWTYDGYQITEQGFHLYPDNVVVTTNTVGGSIADSTYYYQAIYEWTDNQGNIHRSAPSLAVKQITAGGGTSTNTIKVPTYRLTYKSLVKIILYRWSTAQSTYYQVTSISSPTLNSTTADSVTITDTQADATIVGNSILYTTGGVVENIGAPATSVSTLFKSRIFLIDSEDENLLWYSKQVIEATPVEMSDLFTIYAAPTIGAQGNTGPLKALGAMDDKLILWKKNAIYYLVGSGPDNTGANNDFSDPIFITSTVGCSNQNSIVFIPNGLIFESDKGLYLLGRDLSTSYIGAPVENYTRAGSVLSVVNIPGTNQVRFTLSSGITLMYDYFFDQWSTFTGMPSISSTLFQNKHTFINSSGQVFQESPGLYLDGSNPVNIAFTTSWITLTGLQGFQRAYWFSLLGTYYTPHKLNVSVAYDYSPSPSQATQISPDNYSAVYGGDNLYGGSAVYGGAAPLEQWRIFFQTQKCESFQISVREQFDATLGAAAGAGLTLSGLNLVVGSKKGYPVIKASNAAG